MKKRGRPPATKNALGWATKVWNKEVPLREVPDEFYQTTKQILESDKWLLEKARERVKCY